ncbi:hypothetical protein NA57DRAFT_76276 [Rhizodiscina lignyota]|uniref:Uncharacterized protein n=1 Tax=Rhizodiscina lignyota TaxID=1504668 RepID=A0A9P4M6N1_9PEZI|nr:hypothetical protein NA57DRAFT_76276 [Rhizodiscina lignyota]
MAFKPTPALGSRVEARLRGWRTPAVKILRQESKRTDSVVLDPAFNHVPQWEPRQALSVEEAYKMMGLSMEEVLAMRGGTRRKVEREDVLPMSRMPEPRDEIPQVEDLELSVAKAAQRRPSPGPFRPVEDRRLLPIAQKVNSMRYKPPATSYWRHSIYAYNKNTTKNLPSTTVNANKLIRAYFNMVPKTASTSTDPASSSKEAGPAGITPAEKPTATESAAEASEKTAKKGRKTIKDVEEENRLKLQEHKTSGSRIYVSDRGYRSKGMIRQDVLGKISMRMQPKGTFHYPYRDVQAAAPQITYKHYRDGVGISVHVHEGVEEETTSRRQQSGADKRKQKTAH